MEAAGKAASEGLPLSDEKIASVVRGVLQSRVRHDSGIRQNRMFVKAFEKAMKTGDWGWFNDLAARHEVQQIAAGGAPTIPLTGRRAPDMSPENVASTIETVRRDIQTSLDRIKSIGSSVLSAKKDFKNEDMARRLKLQLREYQVELADLRKKLVKLQEVQKEVNAPKPPKALVAKRQTQMSDITDEYFNSMVDMLFPDQGRKP
jgi:hypothetical protein